MESSVDKSIPSIWRNTFANWPAAFKRKGVIEPVRGDAIPFCDFVITDDILVLERATPDNSGARRVAIPFHSISILKYTEPLKTDAFLHSGYIKGGENGGETKSKKVPIKPVTAGSPKEEKKLPTKEPAKEKPRPPLNPDAIHLSGPVSPTVAQPQPSNAPMPQQPPAPATNAPPAHGQPAHGQPLPQRNPAAPVGQPNIPQQPTVAPPQQQHSQPLPGQVQSHPGQPQPGQVPSQVPGQVPPPYPQNAGVPQGVPPQMPDPNTLAANPYPQHPGPPQAYPQGVPPLPPNSTV